MVSAIKSTRIVTPNGIVPGAVYYEDGRIVYVGDELRPCDRMVDVGDDYVSPGFIDLHTHGALGGDYCSPRNTDEILRALAFQRDHGATTVFPTLSGCSLDQAMIALSAIREVMSGELPTNLPGVHIEGPFFSVEQKGGQNEEHLTDADPNYYLPIYEKFGDIISRWDYAPERDPDSSFGRFLKEKGIVSSIAHSNAAYEDVVRAIDDGVNLITHLYSCTSSITRRSGFRVLGVTECAYLFDELSCELICDGKHLPPPLLKMIFKTKPKDKLILVTDSICVAGIGEEGTESELVGVKVVIEDGVCKLLDRTAFCGSIATMDTAVRVAVKEADVSVEDAVMMASTNPARLFGLNKGLLAEGCDADIVVFDDNVSIKRVIINGRDMA